MFYIKKLAQAIFGKRSQSDAVIKRESSLETSSILRYPKENKMKLLNGIGLGTFPFANPFSHVSEDDIKAIIQRYVDHGGIYFDVAPTYAFGNVERLLGETLKEYDRQKVYINTFCGYVLDNESMQFKISGRYKDVISDCNESLQRMQLDYLDAYGHHIPDPETPIDETMQALLDLKKQGKIRRIGVSNVSLEQLKQYASVGKVDYAEMRFSLLTQGLVVSDEFRQYCLSNDIHIVAYQVIERGLLTGKTSNNFILRDGDLRTKKPEFELAVRQEVLEWVQEHLQPIANDCGTEVSTLVTWWALNQSGISLCQLGATKIEHVDSLLAVLKFNPSRGILSRIDQAYLAFDALVQDKYEKSILEFMGLADNAYSNLSASGK